MSLRDNLALGAKVDDDTIIRAVHSAVLEPDVATMPNGLDTEVGALGVRLSGGQVQRTAAARMFSGSPSCTCSTTCRAHSTWTLNGRCGSRCQ